MQKTAFASVALATITALTVGPAVASSHGPEGAAEPAPQGAAEQVLDRSVVEEVAALDLLRTVSGARPAVHPAATGGDDERTGADQLTITVSENGERSASKVYTLDCRPAGGTHSDAQAACDELAAVAEDRADPFAPVPEDSLCTQIDGGPKTAQVTGEWQGEAVDASFNRSNGCEMHRWDGLTTVLGG